VTVRGERPDGSGVNPEPLLAGSRLAGALVWWPLLTVGYLLVAPEWNPLGVGLVGAGLLVLGVLGVALRLARPPVPGDAPGTTGTGESAESVESSEAGVARVPAPRSSSAATNGRVRSRSSLGNRRPAQFSRPTKS
jgi:hypothetical protein